MLKEVINISIKNASITLVLLILLVFLSPVCAVQDPGPNIFDNPNLYMFYPNYPDDKCPQFQTGETAHLVLSLRDNNGAPVPNQVINVRLLKQYDSVKWNEVSVPNFDYQPITDNEGHCYISINTQTLVPGAYILSLFYAGNINDPKAVSSHIVAAQSSRNGGIWVLPQEYIDPNDNNTDNYQRIEF